MKKIVSYFTAVTAGVAVATPGYCADKKDQTPPNIIYIMSDDHASQAISAYGGILATVLPTPNLDRIGSEGCRLDNCFVTNSISTPSRACVLTGQYSHVNGVYTLSDAIDPKRPTLSKELQKLGYQTAIFGKWHLHSEPQGFDYYNVLPGQGVYIDPYLISSADRAAESDKPFGQVAGKQYSGHSTDIITDETLKWIEHADKTKPFAVMCHFKAPHRNWVSAPRFASLLEDVTVPEPETMYEHYNGKAAYARRQHMALEYLRPFDLKVKEIPKGLTRDEQRKWAYQLYIKDYLRCIAGIDENVGRLLKYLDDNGLTENTIIIYTSDQGFFLGEHGWFDKRYMLEESLRMPFMIRYPRAIKPQTSNEDIILNVDFAPMLIDYAGGKTPDYMQGKSFRKNLEGKTPKTWRKDMYYRYWMNGENDHYTVGNYGIRTDRYVLTFYHGQSLGKKGERDIDYTPDWELYDLKKDPMQIRNIYGDPQYDKVVKRLKQRLLDLKDELGDPDSNYPQMQDVVKNYYW